MREDSMSIIEDERLDEKRNRLELEDDEGNDNISDNAIQQEAYNFRAVNDLFTETIVSSEDENIDQLAGDY